MEDAFQTLASKIFFHGHFQNISRQDFLPPTTAGFLPILSGENFSSFESLIFIS